MHQLLLSSVKTPISYLMLNCANILSLYVCVLCAVTIIVNKLVDKGTGNHQTREGQTHPPHKIFLLDALRRLLAGFVSAFQCRVF